MAIIYRSVKGSKLTSDEVDANFQYLEDNIQIVPNVTYQWVDGTLTFNVYASIYPIANVAYSATGQVTLDAADGTHGRYDAIIATSSSTIDKITGTPSATPAFPDIDDATEYLVTYIFVPSGATEPNNLSSADIYLENTEWTTAENTSAARINLASTNSPDTGTVCIESTSPANNDEITFDAPADIAYNGYTMIVLRIKLKAALPSNARVRVLWKYLGSDASLALNMSDWGLDIANTSTYQTVIIPQSAFAYYSFTLDQLAIRQFRTCLGWYIDNVQYQSYAPPNPTPPGSSTAASISVDASGFARLTGDNVQEALEEIDVELQTIDGGSA